MDSRQAISFSSTWNSATTLRRHLVRLRQTCCYMLWHVVTWTGYQTVLLLWHVAVGDRDHGNLEVLGGGAEGQEQGQDIVDA